MSLSKVLHGGKIIFIIIIYELSLNSFRPTDDGTKMEAPGTLVNAALDYAVTHVSFTSLFFFNLCYI
jgi:subtilisin family serine protease